MYINNTLDFAIADSKKVEAVPQRGVYRTGKTAGEDFFIWLKSSAKFFKEEEFGGKNLIAHTWVGNAWVKTLDIYEVSHRYFKAYGEPAPELEMLAHIIDMPTINDVSIRWTFGNLAEIAERSKDNREWAKAHPW